MYQCHCTEAHARKRIVVTGGPGAGKTAVLELARHIFCKHVLVLPEAAGILFGGGFPRTTSPPERSAAQRAIFRVQRELEAIADSREHREIVLCDRGTVDGSAYWPGPDTLWQSLAIDRAAELRRYDAVIHLRTPSSEAYNHSNPLRIESAAEASSIDQRIAEAWNDHPRRDIVDSSSDFLLKAHRAVECLRLHLPACCRPEL